METERKKIQKIDSLRQFWASWSLLRLAQFILALICLVYFVSHPQEWISLVLGLGLGVQAVFRKDCDTGC